MFNTSHPPQLQDNGDWSSQRHKLTVYHTSYPSCSSPRRTPAGYMHDTATGPTAMQLYLWHYLDGVAIYVPQRWLAQSTLGDTLY